MAKSALDYLKHVLDECNYVVSVIKAEQAKMNY